MRGEQARETDRGERVGDHHCGDGLGAGGFAHRRGLCAVGNLVQRGSQGLGIAGEQAAVFIGVVFAGAGDGHLDQRRGNRRENHAQQCADQAEATGTIAVVSRAATEIHQRIAQIGDDSGHGRGDGGSQDVVVVHVHKFVAQHTTQFTGVLVDFRGFLFADFPRTHGGDGEFVGEPVGAERGNQADDDIDAQGLPTAARGPPNQHDDGPHQGKQQRCLQAVEMAVHPYFGIHNAHTKIAC